MKKTLSLFAILGLIAVAGNQCANAFTWSSLNPFNWGKCNRCEKKIDCGCPSQKTYRDCPCTTGAAAPCDPCQRDVIQPKKCDPCDRLQQQQMGR